MYSTQNMNELLDKLMSSDGERMLDLEILKARNEVGDEKFMQYANEFFEELSLQKTKHGHLLGIKNIKQKQDPVQEQQQLQQIEEIENQATDDYQPHFEIKKQTIPGHPNKFKVTYNNGDYYEGEMQSNEKNGWGIYNYSNGQKYDGLFVDDQISGYGKYHFLSGAVYEGDWYKGQKHGFGVLKFSNKDQYKGQFKDDELNGRGIYTYSNGDVFEGIWIHGKKHGRGQLTSKDGRTMIGQWVEDQFAQ